MSSRLALAMSGAALVVALLGSTPLGHALASQVPRNSIGPLQLKRSAVGPSKVAPNAIRTRHVLDGSLLNADFQPGQIPQGPKGDKGEKGDPGAAGLSDRQLVTASTPNNSTRFKVVTARCPTGKVLIGGGAAINLPLVGALVTSFPDVTTGTAWQASAVELAPSDLSWQLSAFVVCARVP